MKKIVVILTVIVVVLAFSVVGCGKTPAKMVFYDGLMGDRLLYITQGSSVTTPNTLLSKPGSWFYISPDGSRMVFVHNDSGEMGDIYLSLYFVYPTHPEEKKEVIVPHDVLYSLGKPDDVKISFKGQDTFLEITYMNSDTLASSVAVYKVTEDNFIKVNDAKFDQLYYFYGNNGGLPASERIFFVPSKNPDQFMLYDFKTGITTKIAQQENVVLPPEFSSDGSSYVYAAQVSGQFCWVLNKLSVETMLLCRSPYHHNDSNAGYASSSKPAWAPDAKHVAVTLSFVQGSGLTTRTLYIFDVSHEPKIVAEADAIGEIFDISWSPDSRMVGFSSIKVGSTVEGGIYTLGVDGNLKLEYTNPEWINTNTETRLDASYLLWFYGWLK